MANGNEQPSQEIEISVSLSLKVYSESIYFAVGPLIRYDAIIGKQWTASDDTQINCHTNNKVKFVHRGKRHMVSLQMSLNIDYLYLTK